MLVEAFGRPLTFEKIIEVELAEEGAANSTFERMVRRSRAVPGTSV